MVSQRAARLVEQLQDASDALIDLAERIPAQRWLYVSTPGEWPVSKDAEHVAAGNALHQWECVRLCANPPARDRGLSGRASPPNCPSRR